MDSKVTEIYGNKVRLRVCGLCWSGDNLLIIKHAGLRDGGFFSPPGGGVEFGETLEEALKREFREETGLQIAIEDFRFGCEFLSPPLHAVELFFNVRHIGGTLIVGKDPEYQIVQETGFMPFTTIKALIPGNVHGIFAKVQTKEQFQRLQGFYKL